MAGIKVTYSELTTAASDLGRGKEEITTKLIGLQTKINNLVASGFVTEQASGKFQRAYTEYSTSAKTCVAKLQEIQTFLTQTATAMQEMDKQIAAKINSAS